MASTPDPIKGVSPIQTPAVGETEFKPDERPKPFRYDRVDVIPRLPGFLTEHQFYDQWADQARINGLPLVEEQGFIVGHCLNDGNCYWSAIATITYGSDQYWPWIKAQHYLWVTQVMENEAHPRYALYRRLLESILYAKNTKREKKAIPERLLSPTAFNAMGIPNAWTSTDITPITADLYGINLVIFIMDQRDNNKPDNTTPVIVKGHPNAPSRFIRFMNGNHFEPMRPDVPRPSEFRYPVVDSQTTKNHPSYKEDKTHKQPHQHRWRTGGQPHGREGIDEELFPRPVLPLPSESDLAFIIGQQAIERAFTREPGWLPPINLTQVMLANKDVTRIAEAARAVYHTWTEPSLVIECTRRSIAPVDDNPTRNILIKTLLVHDREVTVKLVERANTGDSPPAAPTTPHGHGGSPTPHTGEVQPTKTAGPGQAPLTPSPKGTHTHPTPKSSPGSGGPGTLPDPPGSGPTPKPPTSTGPASPTTSSTPPSPPPKKDYGGVRKGDLVAEAKKRGLECTTRDTAAKLRRMLEADDLEKQKKNEKEDDIIDISSKDGSDDGKPGSEPKNVEKGVGEGGKGGKRSATADGEGTEESGPKPKRKKEN